MQNERKEPTIYLNLAELLPSSGKESEMTLAEQIQKYVDQLPPEKQREVLDFVAFLQKQGSDIPACQEAYSARAPRFRFMA